MYSYMVGKIISVNKKTITFENNYVGYVINVVNPSNFEINKVKKLFLYKHTTNNNKNNLVEELYGFEKHDIKELFLMLITINGIGPKTALSICGNDVNIIKELIAKRDVQTMSTLSSITPKYARLIIDNLCERFVSDTNNFQNVEIDKLLQALKSLGYSQKEMELAIGKLDLAKTKDMELSDLISNAIRIIASGEENNATIIKAN